MRKASGRPATVRGIARRTHDNGSAGVALRSYQLCQCQRKQSLRYDFVFLGAGISECEQIAPRARPDYRSNNTDPSKRAEITREQRQRKCQQPEQRVQISYVLSVG